MNDQFDVFISYQWDIKSQVKPFHEKLGEQGIKAWRDDVELRTVNMALTDQLAKAIKKSKIFLFCFTQKYAESKNCNHELNYAYDLGKTIIPLAIDKPEQEKIDGIGLILASTLRINCYRCKTTWFEEKFEDIKKSINKELEV